MQALDRAGIRSLTLKGTFLAEAIYGDPGRVQQAISICSWRQAICRRQSRSSAPVGYARTSDRRCRDRRAAAAALRAPPRARDSCRRLSCIGASTGTSARLLRDMLDRAAIEDRSGARRPASARRARQPAAVLRSRRISGPAAGHGPGSLVGYLRLGAAAGCPWPGYRPLSGARRRPACGGDRRGARRRRARRLAARSRASRRHARTAGDASGQSRRSRQPGTAQRGRRACGLAAVPRGGQREFIRRQLLPPRTVLEERSRVRAERGGCCRSSMAPACSAAMA